jgi:parallel beta-helix repeat protein
MLTLAFDAQPVKAQSGTVYIRADGSIDPPTGPISTLDNVTYTLTGNINSSGDGIIVERDNITIDGNQYMVQGSGAYLSIGIDLYGRKNVTVRDTQIQNFDHGIFLYYSSDDNINGNNITNNQRGIVIDDHSGNNSISGNNIRTNNDWGIWLYSSLSGNSISANRITNNHYGIELYFSSGNNSISGNDITDNDCGVYLYFSSGINRVYHNNFVENNLQVDSTESINVWDDGYPCEGNYWSNYSGTDNNQDGIGDTPHVIDASNTDHYPLMGTFQSFNVAVNRLPFNPQSQFEEVDIISNSTIGRVDLLFADDTNNPPTYMDWFLRLSGFVGQNGTVGFCRITFPNDMLYSSSYPIQTMYMGIVNENLTISKVLSSNGTHTTLYFTYELLNPYFNLSILPEFPSFLILAILMTTTLLAVIFSRRKHKFAG